MKDANGFRGEVDLLTKTLEKYKGYFEVDYRYQVEGAADDFEKALSMDDKEAETLRIGVVGAMKAGKSSFLNMLLFEGRDVLPHAASPMTAALTRIRYSADGECHAIVHYYAKSDWDKVVQKAADYDNALHKSYEAYKERVEKSNQARMSAAMNGAMSPLEKPMSEDQYEIKRFKTGGEVSAFEQAAKEIVTEYESSAGLDALLGEQAVLSGADLSSLLAPYVGAQGEYTPIVNYVELEAPIASLKGYEIVDMPGLGDPITSRSKKTKDFVGECDVVLYFSRGSQFMDAQDIGLLSRMLPFRGVKDGVVICSRFDNLVTGYRGKKMCLKDAVNKSRKDAMESYQTGLLRMPEWLRNRFASHDLVFSSAVADTILRKQKDGTPLTEDEKASYDGLKAMNQGKDLSSAELTTLSGLNAIRKALNEIADNKVNLLKGKAEDKVRLARDEIQRILMQLVESVQNETHQLETVSIEEVKNKKKGVERALDRAAAHIGSHFTAASLSAQKAIDKLDAELLGETSDFVSLKVDSKTDEVPSEHHEGFLGLRTVTHYHNVTTYSLETAQIDNQVLSYASHCARRVNEAFELIVDTHGLRQSVQEEVLAALQDASYTEEDILAPLRIAFAKIKLPSMALDPNEYLDRVHSSYPEGVAKGDDIHKASALLTTLLADVQQDVSQKLKDNKKQIAAILDREAMGFTTGLRTRMGGELDRITAECEDKEKNVSVRQEFIRALHGIQEAMSQ